MLAAQSAAQDLGSIQLLLAIAVVLIVLFWRVALKMVIMVLAIVMIVLITSGVAVLLQEFHRFIKVARGSAGESLESIALPSTTTAIFRDQRASSDPAHARHLYHTERLEPAISMSCVAVRVLR